MMAYK